MSVKEAEKVAISMSKESFVPPPRRIDDILAFLKQPVQLDPIIARKLKTLANMSPPETSSQARLARFYFERGKKAHNLFRQNQALEDFRLSLHYAEKAGINVDLECFPEINKASAGCAKNRQGLFHKLEKNFLS